MKVSQFLQSDFVSFSQCNLIQSFCLPHFLSVRQILSESLQHSFIFRLATKVIRFSLVWKPSTQGKEKNMNVESFIYWKYFKNSLRELDLKECVSLFLFKVACKYPKWDNFLESHFHFPIFQDFQRRYRQTTITEFQKLWRKFINN